MTAAFNENLAGRIRAAGLVAVVVLRDLDAAVPLARALASGGVEVVELTLRTPAALPALVRMKNEVPELIIGAGTVLSPTDVQAAQEAGADFGVSPGVSLRVLKEAAEAGFSFAPGVATPTDIEMALEQGCKLLKFFPAEQIGGLPYFRAISAPYEHLGVQYIPLGGLNEQLMKAYLERPNIAAIGGSWMVSPELVAAGEWGKITTLSLQAVEIARRVRGAVK